MPSTLKSPGRLVRLRGREWVVLPSDDSDVLLLKPLGGSDEEITGIYQPLGFAEDEPSEAIFPNPKKEDLGAFSSARLLLESARLAFRNGAGPFRCLAKLSFRPRAYQMIPLIMSLRHEPVRLLVADDVGIGKTIEALLIVRELLERRIIRRFAVLCLPHLCDQWQEEIRAKVGIEAVVIRSNTQARLDREIHGDASVFQHFPFQVLSIDYIKSDTRRDVFVSQCPELVIVDEAHTCARPTGASPGQQQRHDLVRRIAEKNEQHLILLTATPHSGKPEEFQSLLGLLHSDFAGLDLPSATPEQRKRLARHFVQRRRGDVLKWMGEDTPFAKREAGEISYELGPAYAMFFDQVLDFARKLVAAQSGPEREQRVHYWTALGLLRGIMSSPAAGVEMLRNRLEAPGAENENTDAQENPVHDSSDGFLLDVTPSQTVGQVSWSDPEKRQLANFSRQLESLSGAKHDGKLEAAGKTLAEWLQAGFQPVVFCRYLATARYVGEQLRPLLTAKFKDLKIEIVTSEDPDDVRRQRVTDLGQSPRRLLVATDCLSEGINLQDSFTAVLHYDLPWNPNRLEQREGRVDRFGQTAESVKAYLLFGRDNPVDGLVLGVILEKVRQIRRDRGITVPFPEDSRTVLDTVAKALLFNPNRTVKAISDKNQLKLGLEDFAEAREAELRITHKIEEAAKREEETRSIFAHHSIKAGDLEVDLHEADAAIGEVIVAGKPWLVGRPLGHMGFHPFARKDASLADVTGAQPLRGGYDDYRAALAEMAFGKLTLRNLSGTNRELTWECLLEWLARDQESRFSDLLEWRHKSSDYESPNLLDTDKENLVRIILGLVEGPEQKLLREHAEKSAEHRRLVDVRPSHAYFAEKQRQALEDLAKQKVAKPDDVLLLQAIKTQAKTWRDDAKKAKGLVRDEQKEKKLQDALTNGEAQLLIATLAVEEAKRELSQLQGTLYSTQQSAEREQQLDELRHLKPFRGFCSAPLEEALREGCKLAALRQSDAELDRALKKAKTQAERQEVIVRRQRQECSRLAQLVKERTKARDVANTALQKFHEDREKKMDKADAPRLRAETLEAALQNYQAACDELESLEKKLTGLDKDKRDLDKRLELMEAQHNRRIVEFSRIYDHFVKRLLGNDVTATIQFAGKAIEPAITYHGPYDSTALKLAKFLVFDLSGVALGVTGSGHHPRFLLHDSPREADLMETIYDELFRAAVELEAAAKDGEAPFQYIVTTTQPPPEELKRDPWLLKPTLNATEAAGRFLGVDL